jgi:hypothetical protein
MKYAILGVLMILFALIFHMMFIMFDYAFFDPDVGGLTRLREEMNESMLTEQRNQAYNNSVMLRQGFGLGRVICIALCPILFVIEALSRPKIQRKK